MDFICNHKYLSRRTYQKNIQCENRVNHCELTGMRVKCKALLPCYSCVSNMQQASLHKVQIQFTFFLFITSSHSTWTTNYSFEVCNALFFCEYITITNKDFEFFLALWKALVSTVKSNDLDLVSACNLDLYFQEMRLQRQQRQKPRLKVEISPSLEFQDSEMPARKWPRL